MSWIGGYSATIWHWLLFVIVNQAASCFTLFFALAYSATLPVYTLFARASSWRAVGGNKSTHQARTGWTQDGSHLLSNSKLSVPRAAEKSPWLHISTYIKLSMGSYCVTQLKLYTLGKLSSPIFCCLSVCLWGIGNTRLNLHFFQYVCMYVCNYVCMYIYTVGWTKNQCSACAFLWAKLGCMNFFKFIDP